MLSVRAIYDGEKIKFLEKIDIKGKKEVIVTFLDIEPIDGLSQDLYKLAEENKSIDFLKEPQEDIYTDADLKVKFKK